MPSMSSATAASMRPVLELFDKRYRKAKFFFSLNILWSRLPKSCRQSRMSQRRKLWTEEEDAKLRDAVALVGDCKWRTVASFSHTSKTPKQCRERWREHLDPNVSKAQWSKEEEDKLRRYTEEYGRQWALIAKELPGRSPNAVKNKVVSLHRPFHVASTKTSSPYLEMPVAKKRSICRDKDLKYEADFVFGTSK